MESLWYKWEIRKGRCSYQINGTSGLIGLIVYVWVVVNNNKKIVLVVVLNKVALSIMYDWLIDKIIYQAKR